MDSQGRITSHLSGLFFRLIKLIESDIKLAFVFDGEPPELKKAERERRAEIKKDAQAQIFKTINTRFDERGTRYNEIHYYHVVG